MKNFNYQKLKDQMCETSILRLIAEIYKSFGKQDLFLKQQPDRLEKLINIAKIQSCESSNAIERIATNSARLKQIVNDMTIPRNYDEQQIAGYCDVLNLINESYNDIPITPNYILQLHKILYGHTDYQLAGKTKNVQNYIYATYPRKKNKILFTPLSPFETPIALNNICDEYNKAIKDDSIEPLFVIINFIHDFLCIHPFNDGNGRMSRLLTTLLLLKNGFYVGKYISLEANIEANLDLYYESLQQSQEDWINDNEDKTPFIKYILEIILKGYTDFEDRFEIVEDKIPAVDMINKATKQKIGKFSKQDIIDLCPSLSLSSVEGSLRKLVELKILIKEGVGKATYYYRIKE